MNKFNSRLSKYPNALATIGDIVVLEDELNNISNGKYKIEVLNCRKLYDAGDKIGYKKAKTYLQAITFSGEFNGSHKKENLANYSYFIIIDIDALLKEEIESAKNILFQDEYVFAVWISPSGCGLKVLIRIANEEINHKLCFDMLSMYINDKYGFEVDKSGCDVSRLCFVSYDPNLLIKQSFKTFNFLEHFVEKSDIEMKEVVRVKKNEFVPTSPTQSEKVLFYGTENKNSNKNRDTIVKITKYLKKNGYSITSNYDDWFRVSCAIANSFTYDLGTKYYLELCRLDGVLHDEYKSKYLLDYVYRNRKLGVIDFATIVFLAKQKGFVVKN